MAEVSAAVLQQLNTFCKLAHTISICYVQQFC